MSLKEKLNKQLTQGCRKLETLIDSAANHGINKPRRVSIVKSLNHVELRPPFLKATMVVSTDDPEYNHSREYKLYSGSKNSGRIVTFDNGAVRTGYAILCAEYFNKRLSGKIRRVKK